MRSPVDRDRIESLLVQLGQRFRHPGRVYLVGGSTLVYAGMRAQTVDVDLDYEIATAFHGELIQTLRRLKDDLAINIEEASPAHFIPLPAGYADRARYVGRYGQLDVFHFDPYSMALAKLERGREEDFNSVVIPCSGLGGHVTIVTTARRDPRRDGDAAGADRPGVGWGVPNTA